MAITNIRLRQFKCFADSGDIPLAPLTIVFGRNNTGKSTILQSLLLLRQTIESPEYGPRLDLRGPHYVAGTYKDIVHQHRLSQNIRMQFDIVEKRPKVNVAAKIELEFTSDEPQPPRLVRLSVKCADCEPLVIRRGRGKGGPYELTIAGRSKGGEKTANFLFLVNSFFPLIGPEPSRRGRPNEKHEKSRTHANIALRSLESSIINLRAVGAFRNQPARRYDYGGHPPETIDARGQYVIDALIEDVSRRGIRRGELFRGVNQWLKLVGRVQLKPLKRISTSASAPIYELQVRDIDSGRWANFADVGFGIGQALPVFVEGLRTPPGELFLVQEPEIHLHPDAQLGMADFLVSLAHSGRRVIAETHSENLLLRIRRKLIETASNGRGLSASDVSIIHVSNTKAGNSTVTPLEMDSVAQITNWPKGFMEEATDERMAILKQMIKPSRRGRK